MAKLGGSRMNPTRFHKSQIKFFIILTAVAVFMGLPILFIILQAFKPIDELFAYPPKFFVKNPSLGNFKKLFQLMDTSNVPISRYFFNSLLSTGITVLLTLVISAFAGYALSKKKFRTKTVVMEINNLALMFVPAAVMIPKYLITYGVGMIDSFLAHIFPALAMPVGLFLIKQFIDQIPNELIEAAQIDGAKELQIFRNYSNDTFCTGNCNNFSISSFLEQCRCVYYVYQQRKVKNLFLLFIYTDNDRK